MSTENGVEWRSEFGKERITDTQIKRHEPELAHVIDGDSAEFRWKPLYKIAGAAALITAVLTPIAIAVFAVWPPPYDGTAEDWFSVFQDNSLLGLMSLDLPFVVINILMIPIMLALYVCLRRVSPSFMALAVAIFLVGVAAFFASTRRLRCSLSATGTQRQQPRWVACRSLGRGRRCWLPSRGRPST
jgi:hypothetical protein